MGVRSVNHSNPDHLSLARMLWGSRRRFKAVVLELECWILSYLKKLLPPKMLERFWLLGTIG